MISALCVHVPSIVPAWSHKYKEIMEEFELTDFVIEMDELSADILMEKSRVILEATESIKEKIERNLERIKSSSLRQIEYILEFLKEAPENLSIGKTARKLYSIKNAFIGYSTNDAIRKGAASGGLVTTLLINLLKNREITHAITCKVVPENGKFKFLTVACSKPDDVLECQTSIYSDFNHARETIKLIKELDGTLAIVALPCQWKAINSYMEKFPHLKSKVKLKIGLWCGHATDRNLIYDFLELKRIQIPRVKKFYYRRGLWRGYTEVLLESGEIVRIPFSSGYGLFQNLYIDCKKRCFSCMDHFAEGSDISFGDAWLKELKGKSVKYSMVIPFNDKGANAVRMLDQSNAAKIFMVAPELVVQSQKRAIIWHTYGASGRSRVAPLFGLRIKQPSNLKARWNDHISAFLILLSYRAFSGYLRKPLMHMPWQINYLYMLVQKFFLNF